MNIETPEGRKELAEQIKADIDEYCVKAYQQHFRDHLGASIIGHDCSRYIWLAFRWARANTPEPRMLRLFNRGHREEPRFIEWLRGIGFEVRDSEFNGKQQTISGIGKHFGGSLDSELSAPNRYGLPSELVFLGEYKTSGTGSKFNNVVSKGVAVEKHQHFAQMSVYGRKRNIKYGIYFVINKNDDDLHVEVVELNWRLADELIARAEFVISAKEPLAKLAESETFWKCKTCNMVGLCFRNEAVDINCRSCKNATPVDGAKWECSLYGLIPDEYVGKGCGSHVSILT